MLNGSVRTIKCKFYGTVMAPVDVPIHKHWMIIGGCVTVIAAGDTVALFVYSRLESEIIHVPYQQVLAAAGFYPLFNNVADNKSAQWTPFMLTDTMRLEGAAGDAWKNPK
jgi:hypothetical protein